jgi:hypothetical protein
LHLRDVVLRGWGRDYGLHRIEAHLLDSETTGFSNGHRGQVPPGEPPDGAGRGRR